MATEALEDIDKSNVADPFFVFGHNAFSQVRFECGFLER